MNVYTDSWHYKMINFIWGELFDIPTGNTLCLYFWQLVLSPFIAIFVIFAVILIISAGGFLAISVPGIFIITIINVTMGIKLGYVYVALATVVFDLIVLAFLYCLHKYASKNSTKLSTKQPSVLKEYIKAKKQKICPIIEFKNRE